MLYIWFIQIFCHNRNCKINVILAATNIRLLQANLNIPFLRFFSFYLCLQMKVLKIIFSFLLTVPVYFYRWFISPLLSPSCRHTPSCSLYALDAIKKHGPFRGLAMTTNRILRCRPGGTFGYDPVPLMWVRRYKPLTLLTGKWAKCNRLKEH